MKQLSYIFADLSPLKNTRKYAGFCRAIFSILACCVKTKGQNKDQTKTRKSGPGKPLEAVTRPDLFARVGNTVSPAGSVGSQQSAAGARSPPAGPRCAFLGLHRVGGYRGNEIFFMCEILRTLGRIQCQRILFYVGIFRRFGRGKGPFPAGRPFPPVRAEGPSPGLHRPLRACVRELSRMSRGLACRLGRR